MQTLLLFYFSKFSNCWDTHQFVITFSAGSVFVCGSIWAMQNNTVEQWFSTFFMQQPNLT